MSGAKLPSVFWLAVCLTIPLHAQPGPQPGPTPAPDKFVTWLIHSDWYLIAGWLLVLAIAVFVTFTDVSSTLFRPRNSKAGSVPPEP